MSEAEVLLNNLATTGIGHSHEVPDTDTYFIIDPFTRQIENTTYNKTVLMRGDHNSERFTFEIPRYIDGHDMSRCHRALVHFDNIAGAIDDVYAETHSDIAEMTDLRSNPNKPNTMVSSWLITREATQHVGTLSFSLQYQCVENGEVVYEWNTDSYNDIEIRESKNNSEAATIEYTNTYNEWYSKIFDEAGPGVLASIDAAGAAQVAVVKAESANQQAAIELKATDTLATIPAEYTEVYNMADEAMRTKADSVLCETEGTAIDVYDASDDPVRALTVYGKSTQVTTTGAQLAYFPDYTSTSAGLTWTSTDGVLVVKGTTTGTSSTSGAIDCDFTGKVGTFTISGNSGDVSVYASVTKNGETKWYNSMSFELDGTETQVVIYCQVFGAGKTVNTAVRPMLNAGDTALPWEPYTGGIPAPNPDYPQEIVSIGSNDNLSIASSGINLFDVSSARFVSGNGLTGTINPDGSVTVSGTPNKGYAQVCSGTMKLPIGRYFISGGENAPGCVYFQLYATKNTGGQKYAINGVFEVDGTEIEDIHYSIQSGSSTDPIDNYVIYPMFSLGETKTTFEPYKDGGAVSLERTLPGIPVSTDGNYTDANGQQWLCDEIDFERGVYVKRIGSKIFDGSDDEVWFDELVLDNTTMFRTEITDSVNVGNIVGKDFICTHFRALNMYNSDTTGAQHTMRQFYFRLPKTSLDTEDLTGFRDLLAASPMTVTYALATPIETPLPEQAILAYRALKSNYPNTTVLNTEGAWMKFAYNADTTKYFDNVRAATNADVKRAVDGWLADNFTGEVYWADGKSAYDLALENGFKGTEAQWLASLKGVPGVKGDKGDPGPSGASLTHKWNGTVLTITSASGTSSADLKADPGSGSGGSSLWTESTEHPGCFYRMVDGVKEWLNPPMVVEQPYRTAERCMGKFVCTKIYDMGVVSRGFNVMEDYTNYALRPIRASAFSSDGVLLPNRQLRDEWTDYDNPARVVIFEADGENTMSISLYVGDEGHGGHYYVQTWCTVMDPTVTVDAFWSEGRLNLGYMPYGAEPYTVRYQYAKVLTGDWIDIDTADDYPSFECEYEDVENIWFRCIATDMYGQVVVSEAMQP